MPALRSPLTVQERTARHRLIVRDTVALSSLLALVIALTFITYLLFHSLAQYRLKLEMRWKARGEAALRDHQPLLAMNSLRSALAYAPDDRGLQIELATALAAAGHTQEAVVYFTTLHESEPGNGMINVQLARLSAAQGNVPLAITEYQAALDGTWNGDGFLRRREVRLELARYLISQRRFEEARNQLLIAAGNAADNHGLQLVVARLLEQGEGEADAYTLYRRAMIFADTRTVGLIGAGRTAAAQSRYLLARNLLAQASLQPDFARLPEDERAAVHSQLAQANAILEMVPSDNLPMHVRAVRAAQAVEIVRAQVAACAVSGAKQGNVYRAPGSPQPPGAASQTSTPVGPAPGLSLPGTSAPATAGGETPQAPAGALRSAISAVQRAGSSLTGGAITPEALPAAPSGDAGVIQELSDRLQQLPPSPALQHRLEHDPALLTATMQLVYDLERSEARLGDAAVAGKGDADRDQPGNCAPSTSEQMLLLKIAAAPDEIEQQ